MHGKAWWTAAVAVVLAVACVGGCRTSSPGGTESEPGACRLLTPSEGGPAGDSAGIRVVEQGFSTIGADDPKVSVGVVLRNETAQVAYRTLVTVDALNAAGRTVISEDNQLLRTQVVPLIAPGATVAVGNSNLLRAGTEDSVDSIKVTLRTTGWLEPGDGSNGLGHIAATVTPGENKRAGDGTGEVFFTIVNENCGELDSRGVSLVFRDKDERVVGGSLDNSPPLAACEPGTHVSQQATMTQTDIPVTAELDNTMVNVYCDFSRPKPQLSSGAPYN